MLVLPQLFVRDALKHGEERRRQVGKIHTGSGSKLQILNERTDVHETASIVLSVLAL